MTKNLTCIGCPMGCQLTVEYNEKDGAVDKESIVVTGNTCPRGKSYAIDEVTNPTRIVTGTVSVNNRENVVLSVKTKEPVAKDKIFAVAKELMTLSVSAPIQIGDVVSENIAGTGVALIATKNLS